MKIRFCAALLLAAVTLFSGCAADAAAPVVTEPKQITREEAIAIALADAGLAEEQVVHRKAEFDYAFGQPIYEVEFYSGNREYDYTIHAETGKILSKDKDWDD